jgi:hypothetical protein
MEEMMVTDLVLLRDDRKMEEMMVTESFRVLKRLDGGGGGGWWWCSWCVRK